MDAQARRVHELVSRVQTLVWSDAPRPPAAVIEQFERFSKEIPHPHSHAERLLIGTILADTLTHIRRAVGLDAPAAFQPIIDGGGFARELRRMRQAIAARLYSPRIVQFNDVIQRRFAEPGLTAKSIAYEMGLSVWYLTRIVKRETHHGFSWHLRSARVERAAHLLVSTPESVKGIAHDVGYRNVSELDRQFRAVHGVTPTGFRLIHPPKPARRDTTKVRP